MDGRTKTPRFVLMNDRNPIGPSMQAFNGAKVTTIFGFSGKPKYDPFLCQSLIPLTPFPLVKGFLQRHVDLDGAELRLVALDATSPKQAILQAATFQAVVQAYDLTRETIEVSHELILDQLSGSYQVRSLVPSLTPDATR